MDGWEVILKYAWRQFVTAEVRDRTNIDWSTFLASQLISQATTDGHLPVGEPSVLWQRVNDVDVQIGAVPAFIRAGDWDVCLELRVETEFAQV
jgi:hypothetical protein